MQPVFLAVYSILDFIPLNIFQCIFCNRMGRTCNNDDSMGCYNWNEHKFTLLVWIQSYPLLLDSRGAQIDSNCGKNKSLIVKGAIQNRGGVIVGAVGAIAPTVFDESPIAT